MLEDDTLEDDDMELLEILEDDEILDDDTLDDDDTELLEILEDDDTELLDETATLCDEDDDELTKPIVGIHLRGARRYGLFLNIAEGEYTYCIDHNPLTNIVFTYKAQNFLTINIRQLY